MIICGVVGVGKTTLGKALSLNTGFEFLDEPVKDNPYLTDYYKNTKKYALKMQIYMLMARSKMLKYTIDKNAILARSILDDGIFVEVLKKLKLIDDRDYKVYKDFVDAVIKPALYFDPRLKTDLWIYLRCSTLNAIKRINKRNRKSELSVSYEYWDLLNSEYEKWYNENKDKLNFLVIDTNNKDKTEILMEVLNYIDWL